jgi:predicted PurR-regulated permease PerM
MLGGAVFRVLGLLSPVLWGTATAFLPFIPIEGTALIWGPAGLILILQGAYLKGMILLGIGAFGISVVDNF